MMIKVEKILKRTTFFWVKISSWSNMYWSYLRADSFLSSMAIMVATPICATILPYWLGISENSSHCLLNWSNVTVRQLASDKQAIWQRIKFDAKSMVEGEQLESIHSYLVSLILDKSSVLISCEIECAILVKRSNKIVRVMLSECWDSKKFIYLKRQMETMFSIERENNIC